MNAYGCDGYMRTSYAMERGPYTVSKTVASLRFKCCPGGDWRTFTRCEVTERDWHVYDIDLRTHLCSTTGAITQQVEVARFGVSVYEDEASARKAIDELSHSIADQIAGTRVHIAHAKGHMNTEFVALAEQLRSHGLDVHVEEVVDTRTEITIRSR